jgi:hypothetical protein
MTETNYPTALDEQMIYLMEFMRKEFPNADNHDYGVIPSAIELMKEQKRLLSMTKLSDFDEFSFIGKSLETLNGLYADWKQKKVRNANIFADKNMELIAHDIQLLTSILNAQGQQIATYFEAKYGFKFKVLTPQIKQDEKQETENPEPAAQGVDEGNKEEKASEGKQVSLRQDGV